MDTPNRRIALNTVGLSMSVRNIPALKQSTENYHALLSARLAPPFNHQPWQFSGFQEFVRQTLSPYDDDGCLLMPAKDWVINPDGWCVNKNSVAILEVVRTNDIDENKARKLANLFWMFDAAEYWLDVVLFYPATSTTVVVDNLLGLDGNAARLKGRECPYRDAFESLKVVVSPSAQAVA
jgi:hypothetical protein